MEPFKVSPHLATLLDSYPDARLLVDAATNGGQHSKAAIARLWLSEGIPFAFKNAPALYESVRAWLGVRLDVDPKEIHLTGSGRIGQSLAPKKIGTSFGSHSDLDLFVVSQALFDRIKTDFNNWSYQFEGGLVQPSNETERKYWVDNNQRGPGLIQRGFLDLHIVPNREAYPAIKNISQTMWLLKGKLDITEGAPSIKSASVRCYKDWASYVRQMVISLS
mgnify:CR=1 FL=1|tara:strand:- start:1566 stop:2225 length:660 start_codon:yes stop_codon:yes gene_type:complete